MSTTPRRWRCCCAAAACSWRASRRTPCWRRTCWTRRARATTWTSSRRPRGSRGSPAAPAGSAAAPLRSRGPTFRSRRSGAWLAAEAAAALALADAPAGPAGGGRPRSALPRHGAAARARAGAHRVPGHPAGHRQAARDRPRGRRAARGAGDGDPRAGGDAVQHQLAQAARPTCCSASCRCPWCARRRPAPRPTRTRWRSWPRCTRCPPRSSTTGRCRS